MELYLVRHGEAVPLGEGGIQTDEERPLTGAGHAQARAIGVMLRHRVAGLALIVTSPLLRATQTAEEMRADWPPPAPALQTSNRLAPGLKVRKLARFLNQCGRETIALVGHQPDLGIFGGWLIGSKKAQLALAKGGVAQIALDGPPAKGAGCLIWMVTPEWMETASRP